MLGNYLIGIIFNKQITLLELFQFVTKRSIHSISKAFRVRGGFEGFKIISFRSPLLIFQKTYPHWIFIFYCGSYFRSFLGSCSFSALACLPKRFSIRCLFVLFFFFFFHKNSKVCKYCFFHLIVEWTRWFKVYLRAERWAKRKNYNRIRPTQKQCEL